MTDERTRLVCTRIRITRERDTEIRPRPIAESLCHAVLANLVLTDIENHRPPPHLRPFPDSTREESYSRSVRGLCFLRVTFHRDAEKSMLVIFRAGMLPGILTADLNVKHAATGIPVRYVGLFSVAY